MDFGSSGDFCECCLFAAITGLEDCQTARTHLEAISVQDWLRWVVGLIIHD